LQRKSLIEKSHAITPNNSCRKTRCCLDRSTKRRFRRNV